MRIPLFLLTLFGVSIGHHSFSQCTADAGPDLSICVNLEGMTPEQIGGIPAVEGGSPPYSYSWETFHVWNVGEFTVDFHASDFLNDTTVANPTIINPFEEDLVFTLTVTDSLGTTCTDSVHIEFCNFVSNLGYFSFDINPGDSILLGESNIGSSCTPLDYIWQPSHGLSDSTGLGVWASPDSSTAYYTILTDSAGCTQIGAPYYYINVLTTGLDDGLKNGVTTNCFPNPLRTQSVIEVKNAPPGNLRFEIIDALGRRVWERTSTASRQVIERDQLPAAGVYIYRIWHDRMVLGRGQLIAE